MCLTMRHIFFKGKKGRLMHNSPLSFRQKRKFIERNSMFPRLLCRHIRDAAAKPFSQRRFAFMGLPNAFTPYESFSQREIAQLECFYLLSSVIARTAISSSSTDLKRIALLVFVPLFQKPLIAPSFCFSIFVRPVRIK